MGAIWSAFIFKDPLALEDGLVTPKSQVGQFSADHTDVRFLKSQDWEICYYGAIQDAVLPFLMEIKHCYTKPPSGDHLLEHLGIQSFNSQRVKDLSQTVLPFPAYKPGAEKEDQLHTDWRNQPIFCVEDTHDASFLRHLALKNFVLEEHLYYLLLHDKEGEDWSPFVALLAVGLSPDGRHIVGVVTNNMCHNLCD